MRTSVEIASSFTGTISTGNFTNEKPFYSVKEVWEGDEIPDIAIQERQKALHNMCYEQFKKQAELSEQDRIAKLYDTIRWYDGADGLKYPSVTSIIGMNDKWDITPDELAQYGARGSIIHKQIEVFLASGEWKEPKNLPEIYPDWLTLTQGNLGLSLDGYDFRGFFKDYPFKVLELEKVVLNHDIRYGGRMDIKCIIESSNKGKWEKEDVLYDVPTILDVKTGSIDKTKNLKQQCAYSRCEDGIQQFGLIPLNSTTKQGYSKPILCKDMEKYWSLFLSDRNSFKKRYGV